MRRSLVLVAVVAITATACGAAGTGSVSVSRPARAESPANNEPGPDNPWLHRRVLGAAHAGGENEAPHSTLFAFGEADKAGVHILDSDMQLSSDGIPVVIHNDTVDSTTNGSGAVSDMTYAQLHALDAGYWYSDDCWACHNEPESAYKYRGIRTGAKPPPPGYTADDFGVASFRTLFERYPDKIIDIEIKGTYPDALPAGQALADLIHEFDRADRTVVTSFDDQVLDAFKQIAPEVPTSAAKDAVTNFFFDRKPIPGQQILDVPPFYDLDGTQVQVVSEKFVDDAHQAGMAVWVWMDSGDEENADFYGHLLDLGVDGILAARPKVLMSVIDERGVGWDGTDPSTAPPDTEPPQDTDSPDVTDGPTEPTGPSSPEPTSPVAAGVQPGATAPVAAPAAGTEAGPARPMPGSPAFTG